MKKDAAAAANRSMSNIFQLLDVDPCDPNMRLESLTQRYTALMAEVHPDRCRHLPPAEQALAQEKGAQINEAYRILQDPMTRIEAAFETLTSQRLEDSKPPEDILNMVMTLREAMEEATPEEREDARPDVENMFNEMRDSFYECANDDPENIDALYCCAISCKYVAKILEDL